MKWLFEMSLNTIALYIEEFYVFSNCKNKTDVLKIELLKKLGLGQAKRMLGIEVFEDKEHKAISLSQEKYID